MAQLLDDSPLCLQQLRMSLLARATTLEAGGHTSPQAEQRHGEFTTCNAQIVSLAQVCSIQVAKPPGLLEEAHPWTIELHETQDENHFLLLGTITFIGEEWFLSNAVMACIHVADATAWSISDREGYNRTLTTLGNWPGIRCGILPP